MPSNRLEISHKTRSSLSCFRFLFELNSFSLNRVFEFDDKLTHHSSVLVFSENYQNFMRKKSRDQMVDTLHNYFVASITGITRFPSKINQTPRNGQIKWTQTDTNKL